MDTERIIFVIISTAILAFIIIVVLRRKYKNHQENFGRPDVGVPSSDFEEGPGEGRLYPPNSKQIHVTSVCNL